MKNEELWNQRFQGFLQYIRSRYRSPQKRIAATHQFWSWFSQTGLDWEEVDERIFKAYVLHLRGNEPPYAPGTLYNLFCRGVAVAEYFTKCGYLLCAPKPTDILKHPPKGFRKWVPTPEDVRTLLETPDEETPRGLRDRAILELFYGSGPRLTELANLTLSDVDLYQDTIYIKDTKNGEDRVVPITEASRLALRRYLKFSRPVFASLKNGLRYGGESLWLSCKRRPFTPSGIAQMVARYAHQLELPISAHVLRHACATHLLQGGAGIAHIAAILGHISLDSTQLYTHLKTMDLETVIKRSHPREKPH